MIYCFYGNQADHAHEERMLQNLLSQLQLDWDAPNQWIYIVYNAMWNGQDIDFVCFTPFSIIVGDFKSYSGELIATENGAWQLTNQKSEQIEVKGGNQFNPYRQLRNNKFSLLNFLNNEAAFSHCNLGHIGAVTVFSKLTDVTDHFSNKTKLWMGITDIAHSSTYFFHKRSTGISLEQQAVADLMQKMNLIPYQWQANPPVAVVEHHYLSHAISESKVPAKSIVKTRSVSSTPFSDQNKPKNRGWLWFVLIFILLVSGPNIMTTIGQLFKKITAEIPESSVSEHVNVTAVEDVERSTANNGTELKQTELNASEEKSVPQLQQSKDIEAKELEQPIAEKTASTPVKSLPMVEKKQPVVAEQPPQAQKQIEQSTVVAAEKVPRDVVTTTEQHLAVPAFEEKIQQADDIDSRLRDSGY